MKINRFQLIKFLSKIHSFVYRISNKKIGNKLTNIEILFLTTIGRNSGKFRTVPLASLEHKGNYFVVASFGGSSSEPDWLLNIRKYSKVYIQNNSISCNVKAKILTPENTQYSEMWNKAVEIYHGFDNYKNTTSRSIALVLFITI